MWIAISIGIILTIVICMTLAYFKIKKSFSGNNNLLKSEYVKVVEKHNTLIDKNAELKQKVIDLKLEKQLEKSKTKKMKLKLENSKDEISKLKIIIKNSSH